MTMMKSVALAALLTCAGSALAQTSNGAQTLRAAKATAAAPRPASPEQSATTPANGLPMDTGTNADLVGNAGDPAASQRGSITSSTSNLPSSTTANNPAGPPLPATPGARPY